jgi:hypothetical protein
VDLSAYIQDKIANNDPEFLEYINKCVAEFLAQNLNDDDIKELADISKDESVSQEQIEALLANKIPDFKNKLTAHINGKLDAIAKGAN